MASLHGQPAVAAPCWCVIRHRSNFIRQPGAWNKGNRFISSRWPFTQLLGNLGTPVWNFINPAKFESDFHSPRGCLAQLFLLNNRADQPSWKQCPLPEKETAVHKVLGKLQGAMNDTAGWYTRQGKALLNYPAINYLKHHLENHSALLLTHGKQLLVAKTRRKNKNLRKVHFTRKPRFFSSLFLSI